MSWELSFKPAALNEIRALPDDQATMIFEKLAFLTADPHPDGALKKKLQAHRDLFRLRAGHWRVFYCFGPGWIRVLGVRRRTEDTYRGTLAGFEAPVALPDGAKEIDLDELNASLDCQPEPDFSSPTASPAPGIPLAEPLTTELLVRLGIPGEHWNVLLAAKTDEDLLVAPVPAIYLERLIDVLFPRPLEAVLEEPDLIVKDPNDLARFKEGDLAAFLLRLDPEQERYVARSLKGPTLIKGGAGTGKSTVALYRVKHLLEHRLATGHETVLFSTYTSTLEAVTRQLLVQLLTPDQLRRVTVSTVDKLVLEVLRASGCGKPRIEEASEARERLRKVRAAFKPTGSSAYQARQRAVSLARLSDRYLLDEFDWVIAGRGFETLEEYLAANRRGRGIVIGPAMREAVWELYQAYERERRREGVESWASLRADALRQQRKKAVLAFDHVIVDEAQDLSPVALRLLADSCRSAEGLYFTADLKQSIYARGYTWANVDPRLQFTGRTHVLKCNYRSTQEIDWAAFDLLVSALADGEDLDPADLERSECRNHGPLPVLVRAGSEAEEARWIARFLRQMGRHLRLPPHAAAVLVPQNVTASSLAGALTAHGLAARHVKGKDLSLSSREVSVMTFASAKGLEFPMVVIAGLRPNAYPLPDPADAEALEAYRTHLRQLYVAATRAMRGLLIVEDAKAPHPALTALDSATWNLIRQGVSLA